MLITKHCSYSLHREQSVTGFRNEESGEFKSLQSNCSSRIRSADTYSITPKHLKRNLYTMSDALPIQWNLLEHIRSLWPESTFKQNFLRSLAVMSITTCVWMSNQEIYSAHGVRDTGVKKRRLLSDIDEYSKEGGSDSGSCPFGNLGDHSAQKPSSTSYRITSPRAVNDGPLGGAFVNEPFHFDVALRDDAPFAGLDFSPPASPASSDPSGLTHSTKDGSDSASYPVRTPEDESAQELSPRSCQNETPIEDIRTGLQQPEILSPTRDTMKTSSISETSTVAQDTHNEQERTKIDAPTGSGTGGEKSPHSVSYPNGIPDASAERHLPSYRITSPTHSELPPASEAAVRAASTEPEDPTISETIRKKRVKRQAKKDREEDKRNKEFAERLKAAKSRERERIAAKEMFEHIFPPTRSPTRTGASRSRTGASVSRNGPSAGRFRGRRNQNGCGDGCCTTM